MIRPWKHTGNRWYYNSYLQTLNILFATSNRTKISFYTTKFDFTYDNTRLHVAMMNCRNSLIWEMSLFHINHILRIFHPPIAIFETSGHFYTPKNIPFQKRNKNYLERFRGIKPLKDYIMSMNDHITQWQKYIDIQGSYFDWLKLCVKSLIYE